MKTDNIPSYIILGLSFLLPILALPWLGLSVEVNKKFLIAVGVILALVFLLINHLKTGKLSLPKSYILGAGVLLIVSFLLSALFSDATLHSLIGVGHETNTFSFFLLMLVLMFVGALTFQDRKNLFYLYISFGVALFVVFIFQFFNLYGASTFLSAFSFGDPSFNLVGKWNDLAIFAGFVAVLSLATLEVFPLDRRLRILFSVALILSSIIVLTVHFLPVWVVIAILSFIVFAYSFAFNRDSRVRRVLTPAFWVVLFSVVAIIAYPQLSEFIDLKANIVSLEARPGWQVTFDVAAKVLKQNPILGSGPNSFVDQWHLHKPLAINTGPQGAFWATDFDAGIGYLPTFLITLGILGAVFWILFLGSIILGGARAVLSRETEAVSRAFIFSSFIGAVYLWTFVVIYTPGGVNMALAFLMTGAMIASLVAAGIIKQWNVNFATDPRREFVSVIASIVILVASLGYGYLYASKFWSIYLFQRGFNKLTLVGDLDGAQSDISRAVRLSQQDAYYRPLVTIDLERSRRLLGQTNVAPDILQLQFQLLQASANQNAHAAIRLHPDNYQNWVSLGSTFEFLLPLGAPPEVYGAAKEAYNQALRRAPTNPFITLKLAQVEATQGSLETAQVLANKALEQKSDFTPAIFFLAQIEASQGRLDQAIERVKAAVLVAPGDPGVLFQLGFLQYRNKEYKSARDTLAQAVQLAPNYANAKYFLGLSLDRLGETAEALGEFKEILALNPGNSEITQIIENLENGRAALAGLPSPESREEPPIAE